MPMRFSAAPASCSTARETLFTADSSLHSGPRYRFVAALPRRRLQQLRKLDRFLKEPTSERSNVRHVSSKPERYVLVDITMRRFANAFRFWKVCEIWRHCGLKRRFAN